MGSSPSTFCRADLDNGVAGIPGIPFAEVLRCANVRFGSGSGKSEATFGNPKSKFST
jgi:hypothetical protein